MIKQSAKSEGDGIDAALKLGVIIDEQECLIITILL